MTSTAPTVVFDTNSLWNFAVVQRLEIIGNRYGLRAAWTDAVADEVDVAIGYEPLLAGIAACEWLGDPRSVASPKCLAEVAHLQRGLAGPRDGATKHLGEAECIHIIEHELDGIGWFVTDDNAAADQASRRGIRVLRTADVLAECHSMDDLVCPEPFNVLVEMDAAGRHGVRVPVDHTFVCP